MATITLYRSEDSFVDSSKPDSNYNNDNSNLIINDDRTAWVKFDLSAIPSGSTINSAQLEFTWYLVNYTYGQLFQVRTSDFTSWSEGSITYNNAPGVVNLVADLSDGGVPVSEDVTAFIVEAFGYAPLEASFRIDSRVRDGSEMWIYQREDAPTQMYLTIDYTPPISNGSFFF